MAQVDASRFLGQVALLFAPKIHDGQEFFAYIGEDNSFSVQADNIIQASGGSSASIDTADIDALSSQISALQSQADSLEKTCSNIPALLTQIQTLSGSTDGEAAADFDYAFLYAAIMEMKTDISDLASRIETIENDNSSASLEAEIETLKISLNALEQEVHATVVEEKDVDIS